MIFIEFTNNQFKFQIYSHFEATLAFRWSKLKIFVIKDTNTNREIFQIYNYFKAILAF